MANEVGYQWVVEELDEYGDIIDPMFEDSLIDHRRFPVTETERLALVVMIGNSTDGEIERDYAYVDPDSMTLPDEFPELLRRVPKRFHAELEQWAK